MVILALFENTNHRVLASGGFILKYIAQPMNKTHHLSNVMVGQSNLFGCRNALGTSSVGCFNGYSYITTIKKICHAH